MFWFQKPEFRAFYSPELFPQAKDLDIGGLRWFKVNCSDFVENQSRINHSEQSDFLGVICCK